MSKRAIKITGRYLQIPVRLKQQNKQPVHFYCEGEKILELAVMIGESDWNTDEFDYYGQLPMPTYMGKTVEIEGEVPEGFLEKICCGNELIANEEEVRPVFHFTPHVGWMNDPNGLVYADGVYHFYYQHNPVDRDWENMSWGHAVSTDLLHWQQKEIVLLPEEGGTIYSGSAIVNEHGALGYPKDAILAFYTIAGNASQWSKGKPFVQKVAVSTDGGNTMQPLKVGMLPNIVGTNRDPKVFWHEKSQAYVMILWIDGNYFSFLRSTDLVTWEETQRIELPEGYECPNIDELFTEDGKYSCWFVMDAGGRCYTGTFDGYRFTWSGKIQKLFADNLPYAAQIYSGTPGRSILVPWLRTADPGKKYHCSAGIPRELYVKKEEDGSYYICQRLIAEYEAQKEICDANEASEAQLVCSEEENLELTILTKDGGRETVCYESNGILLIGDKQYNVPADAALLRVIADDRILEIFVDDAAYIAAELKERACGFEAAEEYEVTYYRVR